MPRGTLPEHACTPQRSPDTARLARQLWGDDVGGREKSCSTGLECRLPPPSILGLQRESHQPTPPASFHTREGRGIQLSQKPNRGLPLSTNTVRPSPPPPTPRSSKALSIQAAELLLTPSKRVLHQEPPQWPDSGLPLSAPAGSFPKGGEGPIPHFAASLQHCFHLPATITLGKKNPLHRGGGAERRAHHTHTFGRSVPRKEAARQKDKGLGDQLARPGREGSTHWGGGPARHSHLLRGKAARPPALRATVRGGCTALPGR